MQKKQYEKPTVEKVSFSIEDTLMDNTGGGTGTTTPISGGGTAGGVEPFSLDEGYKIG